MLLSEREIERGEKEKRRRTRRERRAKGLKKTGRDHIELRRERTKKNLLHLLLFLLIRRRGVSGEVQEKICVRKTNLLRKKTKKNNVR